MVTRFTEQAQAHLHQAMFQVDENDVVTTACHVVIERDWAPNAGVRMGETLGAARPRALEGWHPEDGALRRAGVVDGFERRIDGVLPWPRRQQR